MSVCKKKTFIILHRMRKKYFFQLFICFAKIYAFLSRNSLQSNHHFLKNIDLKWKPNDCTAINAGVAKCSNVICFAFCAQLTCLTNPQYTPPSFASAYRILGIDSIGCKLDISPRSGSYAGLVTCSKSQWRISALRKTCHVGNYLSLPVIFAIVKTVKICT